MSGLIGFLAGLAFGVGGTLVLWAADRRRLLREYVGDMGALTRSTGNLIEATESPIATDERGRIIAGGDEEWAARGRALGRAMEHAGGRDDALPS